MELESQEVSKGNYSNLYLIFICDFFFIIFVFYNSKLNPIKKNAKQAYRGEKIEKKEIKKEKDIGDTSKLCLRQYLYYQKDLNEINLIKFKKATNGDPNGPHLPFKIYAGGSLVQAISVPHLSYYW